MTNLKVSNSRLVFLNKYLALTVAAWHKQYDISVFARKIAIE